MTEEPKNRELWAAYVAAYTEMQNAKKNQRNPFHKNSYADLNSVLATIRPVLAEHGLALMQCPGEVKTVDGITCVTIINILSHSSGQFLSLSTQVPVAPDVGRDGKPAGITPQKAMGAVTYGKRYAASSLFGLGADDDDGNEASGYRDKPTYQEQERGPSTRR